MRAVISFDSIARRAGLILLSFAFVAPRGLAQDHERQQRDVQRMVDEGMVAALESRLRGQRSVEDFRLLALAHANKAARISSDAERESEFRAAQRRFERWIAAVKFAGKQEDPAKADVDLAAAQTTYAGVVLSKWVNPYLDQFEISGGRRGDTDRLLGLLMTARDLYEDTFQLVDPLAEDLKAGASDAEERYLALGVFDLIRQVHLDAQFNLGWCNVFIALVDSEQGARKSEALRAAERFFQAVISAGRQGNTAARCQLGLAMTHSAQGRYKEAARGFETALEEAKSYPLEAQIRYRKARAEVAAQRFEEARLSLRPLSEADVSRLTPAQRPARFYLNLAKIWDANTYLLEAETLSRTAETSPARDAILLQARRARENGLARMNRLAARGGEWAGLVQLYVAATIRPDADIRTLTPAELLFLARQLSEQHKYAPALLRLREALGRKELADPLRGEILFELGVCHFRDQDERAAADAFTELLTSDAEHERAPQAATYAYQLWARIAEQSQDPDDYRRLADTLLHLLQRFPEHEKRTEAMWWLPVALQAAGDFDAAAGHFASLPRSSPWWEEAQYRRVLCKRLAWRAEREQGGSSSVAAAEALAQELREYATAALARIETVANPRMVRQWAAEARVQASEVLTFEDIRQYQAALDVIRNIEHDSDDRELIGRALAVRIRAYRGLREFDRAAQVIEQYFQTVPMEEAGPVLIVVGQGLLDEIDRLEQGGRTAELGRLAQGGVETFERLESWAAKRAAGPQQMEAIWHGAARMNLLAGNAPVALAFVGKLLERSPRNGNYRRLDALVRTALIEAGGSIRADADQQALEAAKQAWGTLLRDSNLKTTAPQRYWEARYQLLRILLAQGAADDVERAIRQERVWNEELGGAAWRARFDHLYEQAQAALQATSRPSASDSP